jgi:hypothetical protein
VTRLWSFKRQADFRLNPFKNSVRMQLFDVKVLPTSSQGCEALFMKVALQMLTTLCRRTFQHVYSNVDTMSASTSTEL